jgi:glycosyltransferase involved in cell wall biosynthesis
MNILLLQNNDFRTSHGGANKANRTMLEALTARGHTCRAITPSLTMHQIASQGHGLDTLPAGRQSFQKILLNGVQLDIVHEDDRRAAFRLKRTKEHIKSVLASFKPSVVIVASEDTAQVLLRLALESQVPVVYYARSSSMTGIGPMAFFPNSAAYAMFKQVNEILVNSQYMQSYMKEWSGRLASIADINTYTISDPTAFSYRNPPEAFVTMVNPCRLKGIDIFLDIAIKLPAVRFAAVPLWGTTRSDYKRLSNQENVTILHAEDDINSILSRTRVMLVPSLWDEAFGRIVVESMIYGVPVLASAVGGLQEAKLGVDFLLPVKPITGYLRTLDDRGIPEVQIPKQDVDNWIRPLTQLLDQNAEFQRVSEASRTAGIRYAGQLNIEAVENVMLKATGI